MRTNLDNALEGNFVDFRSKIPDFLTPNYTLQLMAKMMRASISKIKAVAEKLRREGNDISINDQRLLTELQKIRLEDIRYQLLFVCTFNNIPTH